jgi:cellulose synthase/poly-beta-1,6-N-acetylglucosamine synthase-like glycosyltransferase
MVIKFIFWLSLILIIYPYLIYPILVLLFPKSFRKKINPFKLFSVSMIIPARNENVKKKLKNTFELKYPENMLEVIVVNDGSKKIDSNEYKQKNLSIYTILEHSGKSIAQNFALKKAKNEIILFTDCDSFLEEEALNKLMHYFRNPEVGCVTGRLFYKEKETPTAKIENFYWRYECFLRKMESNRNMLTMGSGYFLALRKELVEEIPKDLGDDFYLPIRIIMKGFKVKYADDINCFSDLKNFKSQNQFQMRVRIISKDFRCLIKNYKILNPFKHGKYCFALISHKLLRWFVPIFALVSFIMNIFLIKQTPYNLLFYLQMSFYFSVILGWIFIRKKILFLKPIIVCYDFFLMNLASFLGIIRAILGRHIYKWEPLR